MGVSRTPVPRPLDHRRWVITLPAVRTSARRRSYSIGVRWISAPSRVTRRARGRRERADLDARLRPRAVTARRTARARAPAVRRCRTAWSRSRPRRLERLDLLALVADRRDEAGSARSDQVRISRATSSPVPSGSSRSSSTRSGGLSATWASASAHVPTTSTWEPAASQRRLEGALDRPLVVDHKHARTAAAHARDLLADLQAGQHDAHARAAPGSILDRQRACVGLDETARDREPEASAAGSPSAPAVEGLERAPAGRARCPARDRSP